MPDSLKIAVRHPNARQLSLRKQDDWNKAISPTHVEKDVAFFEVNLPEGAKVELKPVMNDAWSYGPNDAVVGGTDVVELFPTFSTGKGQVRTLFSNFYSHALNNSRDISVYLPPGYDENPGKKYPVIYMMDGQSVFEARGSEHGQSWRADETMDHLLGAGKVPPAIIVAIPHMGTERIAEYSPTPDPKYGGGKADDFCQFLMNELKPEVDKALRTSPHADDTFLVGSSMGGLVSMYAGLKYPEFAKNVAALSPAAWWNGNWLAGQIRQGNLNPHALGKVWVDYGDYKSDGGRGTQVLKDALSERGLPNGTERFQTWVEKGASHSEAEWAKRLPMVFTWLLGR